MKIYTKGGDRGTTSLLSGRRVQKSHIRIESYGTVDELISYCGLLRDLYENNYHRIQLTRIQDRLMTISALLASDNSEDVLKLPQLSEEDIDELEIEIDKMEENLPALHSFILPGGHPVVSVCHVTRTVCRRAERIVTRLGEECELNPLIIKYLNRLSDFFFVLSRLISNELNIPEITWHPKL